ncbi:Transmembrane protein 145 [Hondaea fermentalgiana]|uniref:Transmembrane protein 145 n=1 Tax=Hondaea fermentalgiana TaxID=2315210 RepID=A0A2R5GRU1_9STRA|nr:Transmembrane protein 145 [Hondaea fermentalgiana]|eukprot:GBG33606.1 Transmembrane protein 145 [Hondaea fermentalgiana]
MLYFLDQGGETEFGGWEAVYNSNLNCSERYAVAEQSSGAVFNLKDTAYRTSIEYIDGRVMTRAQVSTGIVTSRSRYFFFAVGNCNTACTADYCADGVDIYWSLNSTNGNDGMFYFGADESSLWATAVVFFSIYFLVAKNVLSIRRSLLNERKYHVTVSFLVVSVYCTWIRLLCDVVVYTKYKNSGKRTPAFEAISLLFAGISECMLILMFMLIMKGWTIVRRKISANGRMRLAIYLAIYVTAHFTCVLFYTQGVDPADVVYMFDTWPGYVLGLLRVALFLWMWRAKRVTLYKYNSKVRFYQRFTLFSSLWVISLPLLVCINYAVDEYFRAKLLYGIELFLLALTHTTLTVLYNPKYASSFPFHATTTAMLRGGVRMSNPKDISETQLRQATEISRRIKYGIGVLQQFSRDLTTFLEEIDPVEKDLIENDEELPGLGTAPVANAANTNSASKVNPFSRARKDKIPSVQSF